MKFNELKIKESMLKAIEDMGFVEASEIQEKTIPVALDGHNVIGEARTGTGKTAAFGIPLIEKLDKEDRNIQGLILSPTRELALQIVDELKRLAKYENITIVPLVGGMSITDQTKKLKGRVDIVVATPGRLMDHLNRKRLDLKHLKMFIIDEVDEMLKQGFIDDINTIINHTNEEKQSLLFSATISKNVLKIADGLMTKYEFISVSHGTNVESQVEQFAIVMKEKDKFKALTRLLDIDQPELAIIFGRTKRRADELMEALTASGYKALALHGDLNQGQRNTVMRKFKAGEVHILVATDVAARGIDVNGVTHVYNFDLPQETEYYVHRTGRTGRANQKGVAYSFIKDGEMSHVDKIMKDTGSVIKIIDLPTAKHLSDATYNKLVAKIEETIANRDLSKHQENIDDLIATFGANKLVACLIEINSNKKKVNDVQLTGEPPVKVKRDFGKSRFNSRPRSGNGNRGDRGNNRGSDRGDQNRFNNRRRGR